MEKDFEQQPPHSSLLTEKQEKPLNAEPEAVALVDFGRTPESLVYLRNHGPVKSVQADLQLKVEGEVKRPLTINAQELAKQFDRAEVVALMQCAGNRRKVMSTELDETQGVQWGEGTVSNANWSGVRLRDVLLRAGVDEGRENSMHVQFESHVAHVSDDKHFGGSIPLSKALSPEDDVLLATHMNDEPLSDHHGFPMRVIVPGYSGARWVKWLTHLRVSTEESPNAYQQRDYKILPEHVRTKEDAEDWWDKVSPLNGMPLNSSVANIVPTSENSVKASGYALPGEKAGIARVDVSINDGKSWAPAKITYCEGRWSWALWEAEFSVDSPRGVVLSKATDTAGKSQTPSSGWNLRGVCYDGYGKMEWSL